MKTSDKFLKYYVRELDVSGKEFSEAITMSGSKIETFEKLDKNLDKIVVGKLLKVEKHPDADKLLICQVDVGTEQLQIVTGAMNVYVGMLCPTVLAGGKVAASAHDNLEHPDGILISDGKLRGVDSHGMLCSIDELGRPKDLYGDCDGIYDLSNYDCKPGDDVIKVMGLDDTLYDFEITSNRVDCYSVLGLAREVAATFDKNLTYPKTTYKSSFSDKSYIDLKVEADDLCKVFATKYVKNIKIKESPEWLKNCLRAVGIRPINNIVDITNFVMMEYGQPMHAYDYDLIRGKKIIVKRAENNMKFKTLDSIERTLDNSMLTICDGEGVIGLAGIMGGENSMITDSCNNLLFEAANFDGTNIRLSSKKLGLRTEASNLFEKGLDPNNTIMALNRACALIEDLDAGEICDDTIYIFNDEASYKKKEIKVSVLKINRLLGTNVSSDKMKEILDKIELMTNVDGDTLTITVPTFRKDINNFADVAEEIMRFIGYDKAPESLPHLDLIPSVKSSAEKVEEVCSSVAIYNGFSEAMNYSFESKKAYDMLKFSNDAKERNYITILNPLGEDFQVMRTQLMNGILKSLSTNYNRKNKTACLFECANIYLPVDKDMKVLPDERKTIILAGYGDSFDFYNFKGYAEEIFAKCNIKSKILFENTSDVSYMHPGRTAKIICDGIELGLVGEVHESVLKNYEIGTKVYTLILDIKNLVSKSSFDYKYEEISKFPRSERDLSMTVPNGVSVSKIEDMLWQRGGKLLKYIKLFDIYEGEQVGEGFKSIAYNLEFGANDHNLKIEEVDAVIKKIINGLNSMGIELRK